MQLYGAGSDQQKLIGFGGALLGGGLGVKGGKWFDLRYELNVRGIGSTVGNVSVVLGDPGKVGVAESEAALARAQLAKIELSASKEYSVKTVSSNEKKTLSGWSQKRPGGYERVSAEQVKAKSLAIWHEIKSHPYDWDYVGQYFSSHAEKQISILSPNHPIGVSKPMCIDCKGYFSKLARYNNVDQIVADPKAIRVFRADGTVEKILRTE